ncbi:MAG: glycosyltransferase, partial [Bacteroidia bacterium]|nr:glycosyltransferase [Bacteroidia bacterium]
MNKNTLYITFDGLSDPLGQSQILPYLVGIAKNGYCITIISCEKQSRLTHEKNNIETLLSQNNISWKYIIYNETGNALSRFKYIQQVKAIAKDIVKQNKICLIHCRSYLAALIGLDFKRKFKIPFLFDMRGFWADERIDGGIWKKNNLIHNIFYKYFKRKEKSFIQDADAIVSLTQNGANYLAKVFGDNLVNTKTTIIPCCTNTNLFNVGSINSDFILPEFSSTDELIIYSGSVGTWYYTREMMDCVFEWNKTNKNIKLLI